MAALLPSEVARLVLGYLEEVNCMEAYNEFLNGCRHLDECRGRNFLTEILGMSLLDMLEDYCQIYSYINSYKCDNELKSKLSKCLNTLDKIKLIFELQSVSGDNVIVKKPAQSYNRVFESHNLSTFKKNRPRYNSCDSVVTVNTEKSHVCYMHSPVKKHNEKVYRHYDSIYPSRSAEILIESTNLADLPGNKSNNENKSSQCRGKEQTVDDFVYSYENKNNCDKKTTNFSGRNSFIRDETNKSSDQITTMKNVSVECDKVDFRHALGLIKHSELIDRPLRTPAKRKNAKIKSALPSLKKNFENALLDWPELHEKIANNINQMMNNKSLDQADGNVHSKTDKDKTDMPLLRDSNKSSEVIIIDDDTQQMDGVIKAIVEKTEKDPIFDQLVNEVLALAPSASGSDSDIMSRPETSTPEKSHASLSNVGSSVSSNSENNAEPLKDDIIKKRLWTWKPNQLEIKNIEKDEATNEISKEYYTDNKNMPELIPTDYIVHKKYPRRTRGGKKMDVLRDNYETLSKFEGSNESSVTSDTKRSEIEETVISPPCDQKIIIISNERVHTNIISNHGEIIIQDSDKPVQNKYVEQSFVRSENEFLGVPKENEGPQKKMIDSKNSIPSLNIPLATNLTQANPASKADFTNNSTQNGNIKYDCVQRNKNIINLTSTSVKESDAKTGDNSISNQMLFPIGYMDVPTLVSESNDLSSGNAYNSATLRNYRHKIITGKPPELVISNNHTNLVEHSLIPVSSGLFTEGKILDNPTVIMYKPDVSGGLGEPISKPCQIINTMKLPLSETKTTISKKSEGIKILPKLQGIVGFSHIYPCEQYDAGKQNIEIKFVDHEGLDVIPIELCSTEISDNVTNPRLQKNDNLTNSNSEINEKVSLNSENPKGVDECNRIIIDMKNDNGDNTLQGNENSMKNFDISDLFNNTINENEKLKTPNNGTAKKMCSSTPSKKYSHIRVLDFNTPLNNVKKRRAMTSPKSILHNQSRTQTSSNNMISSAIKSRLFSPLYEESVDKSQSMGTENTTLSSLNANVEMKCDDTKSIDVDLKNNETNRPCPVESIEKPKKRINSNTSKKSHVGKNDVHLNANKRNNNFSIDTGKCWDKDLRALVASQDFEKSSKKSTRPTMKSVEDVGKLLENALLDQPSKIIKVEENSNNGMKIRRSKGELKTSTSNDISTVADDLELSTNTTTEDINSTQNMLSNDTIIDSCNVQSKDTKSEVDNVVSSYKQKSSFSKSNKRILENRRDSSHKKSLKNDKAKTKSTSKTKAAINTKKTTKTKPFKVKISSKTLTGNSNKKNASNESLNLSSEAAKLSKGEIQSNARNKCVNEDLTNSQVSKCNSKEDAELEIPKSSQITPEFPRELRPNPINVKCNLQSFLETPYKSNLLNMSSMATPRFLSPNDNEPISTIKVLGFPTPKFGVTPEGCSNPKCTPSSFSPKNAGYSSCSSYYKPDEVEELNKESFYSVCKKERDKSPILKRTVKKVSPKLQNVRRSVSPKLSNTRKKVSPRLNNRERKVSPKLKEFETKALVNTRVLRPRRCANVFTSESTVTEKAVNIKKKKLSNDKIMDAQDCAVSSAKENVLFDSSSSYSSDTTDSDYSFSGSECSDIKSPNFDTKLCSSTPYPYKVEMIDNKRPVKSIPKILPQIILQNLEEKRVRIVSKIKNDLSNKKNNTKRQSRPLVTNSNRKSSLINMNTAARRDRLNRPKNINAIPVCPDTINKKTTFNLPHKIDEKTTSAVAKSRRKSATPRKLESKEHEKLQITSLDFPPNISILIDSKTSPAKDKDNLVRELPVKSRFQMNLENEGFDSQAAKIIEDQLMGKDTEVSEGFMNSFEKPVLFPKKDSTTTSSISQENTIVKNLINNDKGDIKEQKSIELPMPTIEIQETTLTAEVNNEPNDIISDNEEDLVVWSEYESDVSNTFTFVYDSNQKKKKSSKKTPAEDLNIDNYALKVNISDLLDRDQACVLTATEFISTFEMSPDPKLRKRKLLLEAKLLKKLAKSSINAKKIDDPRQCVNVEMSNSNSETTSPTKKKLVKNFNDADKVEDTKEVEENQSNLLKKGEEKIIDSVTTQDKNLVNESSKKNNDEVEKSEIENIIQFMNSSNDSVNRLDDEMMNFAITGDVREKRKREDDNEDSDAKKPKTFLNAAVDIEKILTVLHGPENCS